MSWRLRPFDFRLSLSFSCNSSIVSGSPLVLLPFSGIGGVRFYGFSISKGGPILVSSRSSSSIARILNPSAAYVMFVMNAIADANT